MYGPKPCLPCYLGITTNFVFKEKLKSVTIGVQELNQNHTSEYLGQCIQKTCSDWNIAPDKITVIVTDNGANIVKAVTDVYGKNKHLPCFAHTLNLVANSVIDLSLVRVVKDKISSIVTHSNKVFLLLTN